MPELPDIELYVDKIRDRTERATLNDVRIHNPFLLRSVAPRPSDACGRQVRGVRRVGKRVAIGTDGGYWLIVHLMVAGRFQWHDAPVVLNTKLKLAAFDFSTGTLLLTEAGSKKRASLHIVQGDAALAEHDPGGLEPFDCDLDAFRGQLASENRTLKRALTNPRWFSGIGNAYSDEILHAARLSPFAQTGKLDARETRALFEAMQSTLRTWRLRLAAECGARFPDKVTAFRPEMAVHGRFGKPCPVCGTAVARIRYKSNETNYCPGCQTGGRIHADRALSRLLKSDWPKRIEE